MSCSRECFKMHCSNCGVAKGLNTIPDTSIPGVRYIVHCTLCIWEKNCAQFSLIFPLFTNTPAYTKCMEWNTSLNDTFTRSYYLLIVSNSNIPTTCCSLYSVFETKPKWTNAKLLEQTKMLQWMINRQLCVTSYRISRSLECNLMLVQCSVLSNQFSDVQCNFRMS